MLGYIRNIGRVMDSLFNRGRPFFFKKSLPKITIALGLTVVILAGLYFSTPSGTTASKPSSPSSQGGSGFGYGYQTVPLSTTPSSPLPTSEQTPKYTIPWWGWLMAGVVLVIMVAFWWRDFAKYKAKGK